MKPVSEAMEVSRSSLTEQARSGDTGSRPERYSKSEDDFLLPMIRKLTYQRASYGYRRVTAMLNRDLEKQGQTRVNPKRIYRIIGVTPPIPAQL